MQSLGHLSLSGDMIQDKQEFCEQMRLLADDPGRFSIKEHNLNASFIFFLLRLEASDVSVTTL